MPPKLFGPGGCSLWPGGGLTPLLKTSSGSGCFSTLVFGLIRSCRSSSSVSVVSAGN